MILIRTTFLFLLCKQSVSTIDCDDVLTNEDNFIGICNNKWKNLKPLIRPSQAEVGYAWVAYKLDNDFSSSKDAGDEMETPTPAVIGPGPSIYIVDHHHTLAALDFSGFDDVSVYIDIICDKRDLSEDVFWTDMQLQNLVYLAKHPNDEPNALPINVSYTNIPETFSFTQKEKTFSDDPWRSLVGFSRKVQEAAPPAPSCSFDDYKYCERCMYRGCVDGYQTKGESVSYFEFRWAYFINDATYFNTQYWPDQQHYSDFLSVYESLSLSDPVDKINTSDWFVAAGMVVSLCRGSPAGGYEVLVNLYPGSEGKLPGYVEGYLKLDDDPECSYPVCF